MIYIGKKQQKAFKDFLTVEDYKKVAEDTGYSLSTVCNILARTTSINKRNEIVVKGLHKLTVRKMQETQKKIKEYLG